MEAMVSVQSNCENYGERAWLILHDFVRNNSGSVQYFTSQTGDKSIMAQFKITRGEGRGQMLTHTISISGENSGCGRKFIRDMMEAAGLAEPTHFQSYSVGGYEDLLKLHFPAYVNMNTHVIEHIISPYKALYAMEEV